MAIINWSASPQIPYATKQENTFDEDLRKLGDMLNAIGKERRALKGQALAQQKAEDRYNMALAQQQDFYNQLLSKSNGSPEEVVDDNVLYGASPVQDSPVATHSPVADTTLSTAPKRQYFYKIKDKNGKVSGYIPYTQGMGHKNYIWELLSNGQYSKPFDSSKIVW